MEEYIKNIKENGWTIIKGYTASKTCDDIKKTLEINNFFINSNEPFPTQRGAFISNKNVLNSSKEVFDEVTKSKIRDIAEDFIGENPILKNARTYSIKKGDTRFPWHGDNILPNGEYDNSKGIVCILYLVDDLNEGTFWVTNFKSWDHKKNKKISPSKEQFSLWEKGKEVSKIKAEKGDLFIFNQNLYHRHISKKQNIDALFFQIIGESVKLTEKKCIDLSMINTFDEKLFTYLGLGGRHNGISNPVTDINDLTFYSLLKIIIKSFSLLPNSLFKHSLIINRIKHQLYWSEKIRLSDYINKIKRLIIK